MSLTAEQKAKREGKLTASRVSVLMTGDRDGIMRLYREMIGEEQEENLDDVWAVQLGSATERLNLDWYERKNNCLLERRGEVVVSSTYPWMAATLDGWDPVLRCPVECKHVGGFEPSEVVIDRYQPQVQWQMMCTNAHMCMLSIIKGAREPIIDDIKAAPGYQAEMLAQAESFMMCVDLRIPPCEMAPIPPPHDPNEVVNMEGNNQWGDYAAIWLENDVAAHRYERAKEGLKKMIPPAAKRVWGHGVKATRDRANRLHIRKDE